MRTRFRIFEYTVIPFGLCNAPSTFQHFVNDIFFDLVEVYVKCLIVFVKTVCMPNCQSASSILDGLNFCPNFILPLPIDPANWRLFQMLFHVKTTFTPERGRPSLIKTLIMFELSFLP
ncbi:hypothetical protein VP01_4029g2 [Puccinia sorghi]|uniref:Uncharacterized protein n=1 Tax=Puccinia sorghi TaxID=27349 RepID=A0A0L6URR4_9BASI|nr:hypothetical protein VP01_4029g2 [Puccinia sorghi]